MMKNVDNSLFRGLKMHLEGTAPYGEIEALGIAEGGVVPSTQRILREAHTRRSEEARRQEAEQKVINGEITVDAAF